MAPDADADGWWPAPAKINLFLRVLGRRDDGYHEIHTGFQFLDLEDRLRFSPRTDGIIQRTGDDHLPREDLCVRAARALREAAGPGTGVGVDIRLEKTIPTGAGLGGGSSDAATTLIALNRLWRLNLARETLISIGRNLGADVPVFLYGASCRAQGIGDEFSPWNPPQSWYCVLVPEVEVATAKVFSHCQLTAAHHKDKIRGFSDGDSGNDLETPARAIYPQVGDCMDWLSTFGAARMSGSGGAVFVETTDRAAADRILSQCPAWCRGFAAQGINRHPLA